MLSSGKRLEFEGEALAQIYTPVIARPRSRARRGIFGFVVVAVAASTGAILGGGVLMQSGFFGADRRAISKTMDALLEGIASQNMDRALSVCAESPEGTQHISAVVAESFLDSIPTQEGQLTVEERRDLLATIRSELEEAGVDWKDVRPVAFGGIRGRVLDPSAMRGPVTVLTGSIYFTSAGKLFALELTAWRCDGAYVVTELWEGSEVALGAPDLRTYSEGQFHAFEREVAEPGASVDIQYPKHVFFYR